MPRVVLLGSSPGTSTAFGQPTPPAALTLPALPGSPTVIGKLHGQIASLDPAPVTIVRSGEAAVHRGLPGRLVETANLADDLRAVADAVEDATENLLILPANSLIHDELIYQITKSKRGALALITKEPREEDENGDFIVPDVPIDEALPEIGDRSLEGLPVRVRASKSRVISVGSAFHAVTRPNSVLLGPLHLHHKHAATLAEAARELADMAHLFGPEDDLIQLLVLGLVRRGVSVGIRGRRDLFFRRLNTPEEAVQAVAEMAGFNEDRARLNNAVKGADGFFTTYFVSTYSRFIARWAARRGLTPNQVTLISIALGVASAACFATGARPGMIAGAILIYFAFVFDCVDGQVARYARKFGVLGAWLDATFDRFKEYVVFAGLAVGAAVSGVGDVWTLALTAIALQSVKHLLDFSFGAANRRRPPAPLPSMPLSVSPDTELRAALEQRKIARSGGIRGLLKMWSKAGRNRAVYWARKMVVFPIGERFAAIALVSAFFDARITFITLIIWGGVATAYTLTGRLMRSLA
ncbi:CDP-alcohol phosphatidyltransferase family protein [Streptosporangium sp. NPDC001559]|uniref:CDP-alcohol phosphatidyltransferase family protein n=1 Tax=Streptosporangium sp. NPDC001559 TaxID=3366187 RepID=UPI0036ED79EB